MSVSLKSGLVRLLKALSVEEPVRRFYYRTVGRRIPKTAHISGATSTFYVPTAHLADTLHILPEEAQVQQWFLRHIKPGECIWDVGANIGLWTAACARAVGPGGQVAAFEPDPLVNRFLRKNMRVNGWEHVSIFNLALSDTSGEGELYTGTDDLSLGSLRPRRDGLPVRSRGVPVSMRSAESIVSEHLAPAPHALKIDAEGAELPILRGLGSESLRRCHTLVVEVHPLLLPGFGGDVGAIEAWMASHGFEVTARIPRTTIEIWECERRLPAS